MDERLRFPEIELRFDPDRVRVVRSRLASLWGMNLTLGSRLLLTSEQYARYAREASPTDVLYHEYRHFEQQAKVGLVRFLLLYGLVLPIGWNPFRVRWELEAYRVSILHRLATGGVMDQPARQRVARVLSSWRYGWMMRFSRAVRFVDQTVAEYERRTRGRHGRERL